MSEIISIILVWVIGWIILSVGYFIYEVYIEKDYEVNKKLHAWRAFRSGVTSWFEIAFWILLCITYIIGEVNDWVEEKLS